MCTISIHMTKIWSYDSKIYSLETRRISSYYFFSFEKPMFIWIKFWNQKEKQLQWSKQNLSKEGWNRFSSTGASNLSIYYDFSHNWKRLKNVVIIEMKKLHKEGIFLPQVYHIMSFSVNFLPLSRNSYIMNLEHVAKILC